MKNRSVKGKRIKQMHQRFSADVSGGASWTLEAIELDDGSFIRFLAVDTEDMPLVVAIYPGRSVE